MHRHTARPPVAGVVELNNFLVSRTTHFQVGEMMLGRAPQPAKYPKGDSATVPCLLGLTSEPNVHVLIDPYNYWDRLGCRAVRGLFCAPDRQCVG